MRAIGLFVLMCCGCLGSTYSVPKGELLALAVAPPQTRGGALYVEQGFAGDGPPESCCISRSGGGGGDVVGVSGGGGDGGSGGSRPSNSASGNIRDARAILIAGAALTVALAVNEGRRFTGWVAVEPDHPLYLRGPGGEYVRLALSDLDAGTAAWAQEGFIRADDGTLSRLRRAPLDRRGLSWTMLGGTAQIGGATGIASGFMSHMQAGYFPLRQIGVAFDLGIGWRDADQDDAVYRIHGAGELELFPLAVGRVHAGAFAQLGLAARSDDGAGRDIASTQVAGGGLLQVELSTYLALTGRAGITQAFGEHTTEMTLGLSIY